MAVRNIPIPPEQLKVLRHIRETGLEVLDALNMKFDIRVEAMLKLLGIERHPEGINRRVQVDTEKGEIVVTDEPAIITP